MKKLIIALLLLSAIFAFAKTPVIAVVIDEITYNKTASAVDNYCSALEEEGYSVALYSQAWENPEAVREVLLGTDNIEGAVFIGDIPIPMVQDAQHLTSAFKIDQARFNPQRISVASDRYYDDPDLIFNFIKQDEDNPLLFYYSLSENSPQYVEKDFYSGRIIPPVHDDSKYEMIAKYLDRAAYEKRNPEILDNMMTYTGHGYHSESLNAWENHTLMLKEQFPDLFIPGGKIKNYEHTMSRNMKKIIMRELQVPELDMVIFHAHGGDDTQYLTGYPPAGNAKENIEEVKRFVRSKLRSAKRRGNLEEAKEYYITNYDIPEHWVDNAFDPEVILADSIYDAKIDLWSDDVKNMKTQAEVFIFDECYNGQFYKPNYISGAHLFGDGNVIAGVANSVNVRQDIWANEMLGLLKYGVPIGEWHLTRTYLESHIIGDPTFHFAENNSKVISASYKKLLNSKDASLRTLGVYKMTKELGLEAENKLLKIYKKDLSANVRLETLKSLATLRTPAFRKLLVSSIHDPSELIRRITVNWMGKIGDKGNIPLLAERMTNDISERVSFSAKTSLELLFAHPCADDFLEEIAMVNEIDTSKINHMYRRSQSWLYDEIIPTITDTSLTAKKRMSKVRTFRNYNFTPGVKTLLEIAQDETDDPLVRKGCIEALGWFVMNPNYKNIISELELIDENDDALVVAEVKKSIKRLTAGANLVITP
ncbi:MAG: HEAT repeat domain-containing protein [Candidatus Marinimicrobia bacterium]|nr:HEAT repeat domain-containing protein [Candidatus Neomarinimicrobiota bacterium]